MARLKVDENLPTEVAELLCDAGHDAMTVHDQGLAGQPDAIVAQVCRDETRAIVTLDVGLADIRAYPPAAYAGIVVLRLARLDKSRVLSILQRLLPVLDREQLRGRLWVVDETRVRVRE